MKRISLRFFASLRYAQNDHVSVKGRNHKGFDLRVTFKQKGESDDSTPPSFGISKNQLEIELAGKDNLVIEELSVAPGSVESKDCLFHFNRYTRAE